jgi:hypothetical protein
MPVSRARIWILLLLVVSVLAVYWNVQDGGFLNYDDQVYVTDNPHLRLGLTWPGVRWAFRSTDLGFWHPLTWLSLLLDYQWYGLHPAGYHWTNLLLHLANTLLLFALLHRMTGAWGRSCLVAALFALHPLHVESVAWVAERKDVLSAFFWMLTMGAYIFYAERPGWDRYLLTLFFFLLGLMAKPMLVSLPLVLLLIDYWPLNRFRGAQSHAYPGPAVPEGRKGVPAALSTLILEKVPLALLSGAASWLVYATQQHFGALASPEVFPVPNRMANAVVSYGAYLAKTIFPWGLAAFYPYPGHWPLWRVLLSGFVLLTLSVWSLRYARRLPYLAVGWLWFLGVLLPVIGLVQIGSAAMADRFTYLPLVGIFLMMVWGSFDCPGRTRQAAFLLMGAALILWSCLSWMQVQYWQNDVTLFRRAIQVTDGNYKAMHILGLAYHRQGDDTRALDFLTESIRLKPDESRVHNDLGVVYMGQKRFRDAQREFTLALRLRPDNVKAINNLGAALASQGITEEAEKYFNAALRWEPENKDAMDNLRKIRKLPGRRAGAGMR